MTKFLQVTFAIREPSDGDWTKDLESALGIAPGELASLEDSTGGKTSLREGGVGKGASGPAVDVLLELANNTTSTVAGLIVIGEALRRFIVKMKKQPQVTRPSITEGRSLAAVVVAGVPQLHHELELMDFVGARPLTIEGPEGTTIGQPWAATDAGDVWCVTFSNPRRGYSLSLFASPTGQVLGHTRVPHEMYFDGESWIIRSPQEIENFNHND